MPIIIIINFKHIIGVSGKRNTPAPKTLIVIKITMITLFIIIQFIPKWASSVLFK